VLGLYGHDVNWHWQRRITRLGWASVAQKVYVSRRMAEVAGEPDGCVIAALSRRGYQVRELILPEPGQTREQVPLKFNAADVVLFTSRKGFERSPDRGQGGSRYRTARHHL
jgi:teichuronic acid biosynthesis glycosyltransferase TuaC